MPEFSEIFSEEPVEALRLLTAAVIKAQTNILEAQQVVVPASGAEVGSGGPAEEHGAPPLRVNQNVHARMGFMPHGVLEHNRTNISGIRSSDVGLFLQVTGTVIRTGTVGPHCSSRCNVGDLWRANFVFVFLSCPDQDVGVEEDVSVYEPEVPARVRRRCRR